MMKRIFYRFFSATLLALGVLTGLIFSPANSTAQSFFNQDVELPDVLATFQTRMEPAKARPGEHVRLIITARIAKGWYTYSVMPQGEYAPPPTELNLKDGQLILEGPFYETNPTIKKDKVFKMPLAFHKPAARFYQNFSLPEEVGAGELFVEGYLRYQVCNDKLCTPPRNENIKVPLQVESGPVRPAFAYAQRTIDFLDEDGNFIISADTLERALSGGLWAFLLMAVGFGLLALLTPCVFPMLPITVAFFTGESERHHKSVLKLALLFAGGIVITYTGLGLVLTFLLGAAGVSQFATNPWVNMAVALFFTLFALGLLGLLEFALPAGMVQGLDSKARKIKGPVGVLLMGIAFTATSFTCTMPFVGTLLIAATQGEILWPLVGMLVFSTVFAFPFFLLALFPKFLTKIRGKSGNWLVQLKVTLGLVELAAALKFVSNADLIWGWGFFDRELLLVIWVILAVAIAIILLGLLPWPGIKAGPLRLPRLGTAGLFLALGIYLALGLTGRNLDAYTEAYLPPSLDGESYAEERKGDFVDTQAVHDLAWQTSLETGLMQAAITNKPIFIDFTGYTCVNCRWMEKNIFAEQSVFNSLKDDFVLVQLYTDGGENAEKNQKLQIERFRTMALPYYVILSPDNSVLAKHAGIIPTPEEFLSWLKQGNRQVPRQSLKQPCQISKSDPNQSQLPC